MPASPGLPHISRRAFLAGLGAGAATVASVGYYAGTIEPFWLDVHEQTLRLDTWPAALHGIRITHLTDLHLDRHFPIAFANEIARRVREEIKPDLVAFTGDLTTHNPDLIEAGARWLSSFGCPTFVCLGNHDYATGLSVRVGDGTDLADSLTNWLGKLNSSVKLLRNANAPLEFNNSRLHVAGVEDFYTGLTDPKLATAGLPDNAPVLMLNHNPDAAALVDPSINKGLILSGHTHGGQLCLPFLGPVMVNIRDKEKANGLFKLPAGSSLYVSRGCGYLLHARFLCRPEIITHRIACRSAVTQPTGTSPANT
jgi:predicted MPP superfamily phosphohydrolase